MNTTQNLVEKYNNRFATIQPLENSYSQSGWKGIGYDSSISVKEIVQVIREVIKRKYPKVKISVRKQHYSSLSINLMQAPFEVFATPDASKLTGKDLHWGEEDAMNR